MSDVSNAYVILCLQTWKVRWFVLRNTNLSYYKTKQVSWWIIVAFLSCFDNRVEPCAYSMMEFALTNDGRIRHLGCSTCKHLYDVRDNLRLLKAFITCKSNVIWR